ncbi:hypothetical protein HGO21_29815 [Acinetobacter sp. CUI P1]|nr:hypothetical protein [Acinetobacter sp. CUI P1]
MILDPLIKGLEEQLKEQQLKIYNDEGSQSYLEMEFDRTKNRLEFLKEQWVDAEKDGSLDEPVYEHGSIEYYRKSLSKNRDSLDMATVQYTQSVLENDSLKSNQKIKMLNNLMKVYSEYKDVYR